MKAGWEVKALGDFADIRYGYTASAKYDPVGPRFLRITDIQDGAVDWDKVPYCEIDAADRKKFSLAVGDIVFARTGATTGKSYLIQDETDAVFASYLIKVRATRAPLDSQFLAMYFQTSEYWDAVALGTEGAAQGGFNASKLATLQIPLPPLDEQKRIVAVLDAAFEGLTRARAHTETNLQNARELFDGQRRSLLANASEHWKILTLDQACKVERGSSPRPIKEFFTEAEDGVNWIKIGDTDVGAKYVTSTREKITPKGALQSRRVRAGDFILTNSMTFGRPYIMAIDGYIHDGWFVLRLNEGIQSDFFYHLLSSTVVQDQFQSLAAGAVVKNISGDLVKKAVLHIPPFQDQAAIAMQLDEAAQISEQLKSHYHAKLADIDDLRQSILQKAFAGELT